MDLLEIFDRDEKKLYQAFYRSLIYGDNSEMSWNARKIVEYERVFQTVGG